MKIVLAGGSGSLGQVLARSLGQRGHQIVVLSRGSRASSAVVHWDGRTAGPWMRELDGADAVINLAGRSVNCRYTEANRREMMDSRVDSTRAVGLAIQRAERPPRVWLQMSTATIYAHRFDAANDEATGVIGGDEPDAPASWRFSIEIARAWEAALYEASTPATRKVALRSAVVMTTEPGSPFDLLLQMTRLGLGGPIAGGHQFVSWIHACDFARAVEFLLERDDIDGAVNVAAPAPLSQREFMADLREAAGMPVGLPATVWMAALGAFVLRSETELLLKSRRVTPGRLLAAGFQFEEPAWARAAQRLVAEWQRERGKS